MKLRTQKSVAIRSAPDVKLESVDNSTAVAICGNYQTVNCGGIHASSISLLTVMALEDNTRSHPNPEALELLWSKFKH